MTQLLHLALDLIGCVLVGLTLPLVFELLMLSLAAALPARRSRPARTRPDVALQLQLAVVIPAHNEEQLVAACVRSLRASLSPPSAIYVVAHNCSDATAQRAAEAGATILELREDSGHGKGAALDHGFHHALHHGADAVLVVDADSIVAPTTTLRMAEAFASGAAAAQCRYIASNATDTPRTRLQALALTAFNVVRPRGRARLGLSCGIFGNGFALSRRTLEGIPYTAHSLVEDLEYHLALVRSGLRVVFVDDASVAGEMPTGTAAAATQRARWEGGRSLLRRHFVPRLLRGVLCGNLRLLEPLLDLLALPTATGALLLLAALALPLPWLRLYAVAGFVGMATSVLVAAALTPEGLRTLTALSFVPRYVLFKLKHRGATAQAASTEAAWVRTPRNR